MDSSGSSIEPMVAVFLFPHLFGSREIVVIEIVLPTLEVHYSVFCYKNFSAEIRAILQHLICFKKGSVICYLIETAKTEGPAINPPEAMGKMDLLQGHAAKECTETDHLQVL